MYRNLIRHQRLVAMLISFLVASLLRICLFSLTHPPHFPLLLLLLYRSQSLSCSIINYPLSLSFSSGHCEIKMRDWRTDRWCCMQLLLPKSNSCLGSLCKSTRQALSLMNSLPLPHEDDLLLNSWINPLPCTYKYWWSQMSQRSHVSWWLDTHAL